MKTLHLILAVALLATFAVSADAGVEEVKFGGRFMQDWTTWLDVDDNLGVSSEDGTEIRRARLFASGKVYSNMKFKVNFDFAGGEVALKDGYVELVGLPAVGNLRLGHFNEPFGMEELTSSKYITFLERSSLTAFTPGRNSGLMFHDSFAAGRGTWQAGAWRGVDDFGEGEETGGGLSTGARVTFLVVGEPGDDRLVHIGGAVNRTSPYGDELRLRERPEIHQSDRFVNTDYFGAESVLFYGGELVGVFGPVHFQGEYMAASVASPDEVEPEETRAGDDPTFSGFSVQAGYFVTGEARAYKGGLWGRTKPSTNFLGDGGLGAVELAVRYSSLDLNDEDADIYGGKLDDITVGLNWYMHSNARMMLNYINSSVKDSDDDEIGTASAVTLRLQVDF